jgi:hypothetical protein
VLDVVIGLSFIFLLLSLAASALQEYIANLLSLRARTLEKGLRNMLVESSPAPPESKAATATPEGGARDLLDGLYKHPLVRSLYRGSMFGRFKRKLGGDAAGVRLPSYIAPRSFALALVDTLTPGLVATDANGVAKPDHDVIRETREAIEKLDIPQGVKHRLLTLLDDARGDLNAFRNNLEAWFDDTMARVSGWYKRKAQLIILVIATGLTIALNANTLTIGERLWRDPTLRATIVAQAAGATGTLDGDDAKQKLDKAIENVESVAKTGMPIGWNQSKAAQTGKDPRYVALNDKGDWLHLLGGWALTILAISLGAPFWFDTLSRLSRLRGTGKPETPLPASGFGQPGERVVSPAPVVNVTVQAPPTPAQ